MKYYQYINISLKEAIIYIKKFFQTTIYAQRNNSFVNYQCKIAIMLITVVIYIVYVISYIYCQTTDMKN